MKTILSLVLMAASAVAVSGCKYASIDDGKIPAGYEQYAREAEGTYVGRIADKSTTTSNMRLMSLQVSYVNDRIVLKPSIDWLGEKCGSKIGNLLSVETSGTKLKTAVFAFNGGSCTSTGRLVIRMFGQSSGKPKLVAWVTTGYSQFEDQGGIHTTSYETQADLRKQ